MPVPRIQLKMAGRRSVQGAASLAIILATMLALTGCGRRPAPELADAGPPVRVHTAVVTSAPSTVAQRVPGTVRPVQRATIASQVMARVEEVHVLVGAPVAVGDPLLTLRAPELAARVEQARAQLGYVNREHEREVKLLAQGATTAESVRALADQRRIAIAALEEAETMLGYTRITAPYAGVVTRDFVRAGDLATPGAPLLLLEGLEGWQVEAQVPESLPRLAVGSSVMIEADGESVAARLVELSPAADSASRTRLAKLALPPEAGFRSGQFVRVLWPQDGPAQLALPPSAVSTLGQMQRVFVVEDQRARLRLVRTGGRTPDRVTLLSGVQAGEMVVLDPPNTLRDGQRLEIVP
jgi:RND family efflux transporter MFP subunit